MTDRLATQLVRIARDPASGRLRHRGPLAIGLRAALFADLLLAGRIVDGGRGPVPGPAPATGDRILEAVAGTVERRPNVAWWRWYRHVRVDVEALTGELVEAGRWTPRGSGFDEADPDGALALAQATLAVAEAGVAPADSRQALLAVLAVMCGSVAGRPRPRALRGELAPLVLTASSGSQPGAEQLPAVLRGAERLMRRPLRRS